MERCNEYVSNTARTSDSFDCGYLDSGDAKAFELRDRSLSHHNRNTGIDARLLVARIPVHFDSGDAKFRA